MRTFFNSSNSSSSILLRHWNCLLTERLTPPKWLEFSLCSRFSKVDLATDGNKIREWNIRFWTGFLALKITRLCFVFAACAKTVLMISNKQKTNGGLVPDLFQSRLKNYPELYRRSFRTGFFLIKSNVTTLFNTV